MFHLDSSQVVIIVVDHSYLVLFQQVVHFVLAMDCHQTAKVVVQALMATPPATAAASVRRSSAVTVLSRFTSDHILVHVVFKRVQSH